jgi:hypothetical protein
MEFNSFANQLSPAIGAMALVITPYLFGFIFSSISTEITKPLRKGHYDAVTWVTDANDKRVGEGLKEWEKETIKLRMKELYKLQDKAFSELFFTIRVFVKEHSHGAGLLATRALDLTNFVESLIIPLPLFCLFVGIYNAAALKSYWAVAWIIVAVILFGLLIDRYLRLRSYWIKHVYRAFIAITARKEKSD